MNHVLVDHAEHIAWRRRVGRRLRLIVLAGFIAVMFAGPALVVASKAANNKCWARVRPTDVTVNARWLRIPPSIECVYLDQDGTRRVERNSWVR
jgi:hypothetical protein